jgi:hypothetical protein
MCREKEEGENREDKRTMPRTACNFGDFNKVDMTEKRGNYEPRSENSHTYRQRNLTYIVYNGISFT